MFKILALIGTGSFIGGISRYLFGQFVHRYFPVVFPYGTLAVNITGCFLLGYLQGLARVYEIPDWVVAGLGTGLIGAFTTFSTFSMEVIHYLEQGEILLSFFYIIVSSVVGYYLVFLGFSLAKTRKKEV